MVKTSRKVNPVFEKMHGFIIFIVVIYTNLNHHMTCNNDYVPLDTLNQR